MKKKNLNLISILMLTLLFNGYLYVISIETNIPFNAQHNENSNDLSLHTSNSGSSWDYETGGFVQTVAISSDGSYTVAGRANIVDQFLQMGGGTPLWSSLLIIIIIVIIVLVIIISIVLLLYILIKKKRRKRTSHRYTPPIGRMQKHQEVTEEMKHELFGIIQLHKKLEFTRASKIMEIPEPELKRMMYQLVGRGDISGTMEKKAFILESGVGQFIDLLDDAFTDWEGVVDSSEGKKL